MSQPVFIGIDGGGSTLRIGAYGPELRPIAEITVRENANPSVIGKSAVADLLTRTLGHILAQIPGGAEAIDAVGVGMAGADALHSGVWLRDVLKPLVPGALVVPSSDYEIALVGAVGERYGVLLLAGTGCVAYGMNRAGETLRMGGWGYLFSFEGSGFWLGQQALTAMAAVVDVGGSATELTDRLAASGVPRDRDGMVRWVYHEGRGPSDIAALASVVLNAAADGDETACEIIDRGVARLVSYHAQIVERLGLVSAPIAFAGGLLGDTVYASTLVSALGLDQRPPALYTPVKGAALLARLHLMEDHHAN
jgi:N-acetylglucosamine kinase-like BadF-type ATPase